MRRRSTWPNVVALATVCARNGNVDLTIRMPPRINSLLDSLLGSQALDSLLDSVAVAVALGSYSSLMASKLDSSEK